MPRAHMSAADHEQFPAQSPSPHSAALRWQVDLFERENSSGCQVGRYLDIIPLR